MPLEEVAQFSISNLSILDEQGNVDDALDPGLTDEDLLRLYRSMVLARETDQRMLKLQRQGRIAAHCVPAFLTTEKEWVVFAFRETGAQLMRGVSIPRLLLYYNGYEEGNVLPRKGRTAPISIIVGSQLLHAVGIGYALKYRKEKDAAVVVFFGDGATSQGDFHEALNFAGVWQVPVIFICQNNGWAISLPRSKQTHSRTLAQKAIAYDINGIQVDGNDVLAMYRATKEALDRARAGEGPTLIEAVTYRLMMHTTADDPKKYRTEEDVQAWWKREPLARFRKYLEKKGIWDAPRQGALETEIRDEIEKAVTELESMKDFKPDAPFDHVFGTRHRTIDEQRAEFLADLKKEAPNA
jgi:pyruvate dehydrogenase E1 component alpha subunit